MALDFPDPRRSLGTFVAPRARMTWGPRFAQLVARKTAEATAASIAPLTTVRTSAAARAMEGIGNEWTCRLYDGTFHLPAPPDRAPAVTLVFVQSRTGNTVTDRPDELGGGDADRHLIYEGLSRVAAGAVLAGARTATGAGTFFSVWHPELVALRRSLGLPRHPVQVVVSKSGHVDVEGTMLFNVPDVPVVVLAGRECLRKSREWRSRRPWLRVLPVQASWADTLAHFRSESGISRVSVVGGRTIASALIDADAVQDLLLTTTSSESGEPDTPYYSGAHRPDVATITEKTGLGSAGPIRVEHLAVSREV